jgi:hypothetical protein
MPDDDRWFTDSDDLTRTMEEGKSGRRVSFPKREEAHRLVDYWVGKATGTHWPTLKKDRVLEGLQARIDNPNLISQKSTNLCGVASFVRELAWDDPCQYGLLGALLYEGGWGNLGKRRLTRIEPRAPTKREPVPARNGQEMNHADWLVLASVRDAFNTFAYVHDVFDGLRGMTIRAMPAFFRAAGYDKVVPNFNAITPQGVANMEAASSYFKAGYAVVLFIHSSLLDNSARLLPTAQHWVVLRSPIELNYAWKQGQVGVRVEKIWSWGREYTVPSIGYQRYLPLPEFASCYYGYVAAQSVL